MQFKEIIGQHHIKNYLIKTANSGRIPHAQIFTGPEGSGTLAMAIAYTEYILCKNNADENNLNPICVSKFKNFSHPDLHFVFPVANTSEVKSHAVSNNFLTQWRQFLQQNIYASLFDWYSFIDIQNKQGQIGVDEAAEINKTLSLKAYEGGYKIMIVWMAEKMNTAAANKLLKLLEEPPNKTIFILITETLSDLLPTIISRCQVLDFLAISEENIASFLVKKFSVDENIAKKIAHESEGNLNKALKKINNEETDVVFDTWFVNWVRTAFRAKGNATAINDLISWAETISSNGREVQKQFLLHCIVVFRQTLLLNYGVKNLVYLQMNHINFDLNKFAPFVNNANILDIYQELEKAIYHIERNGNSKIILTDLSIKLTRLIHKN